MKKAEMLLFFQYLFMIDSFFSQCGIKFFTEICTGKNILHGYVKFLDFSLTREVSYFSSFSGFSNALYSTEFMISFLQCRELPSD